MSLFKVLVGAVLLDVMVALDRRGLPIPRWLLVAYGGRF